MRAASDVSFPVETKSDPRLWARVSGLVGAAVLIMAAFGFVLLPVHRFSLGPGFHTAVEALASSWALGVGSIAMVRYYSRRTTGFLFVGTAFLGAGVLDAHHSIATAAYFSGGIPMDPGSPVSPWGWLASRLFLSAFLWMGWLRSRREARGAATVSERSVYLAGAGLTLALLALLETGPLPGAYSTTLLFPRPQELVPALFFLFALVGYLRDGGWRTNAF
jgi:hypothetical protein